MSKYFFGSRNHCDRDDHQSHRRSRTLLSERTQEWQRVFIHELHRYRRGTPSSQTFPRTVRLVICTTDLHGVVSLREYVETVAPLPTVDVMAVIVDATWVTRQDPQKASKARHIKIKGRNCADISSKVLEANKHGWTFQINMRTPCVKNPLQGQQTHDKSRRHTKTNTTNACRQMLTHVRWSRCVEGRLDVHMLAKYIAGRITLPCLKIGLLSSCHSLGSFSCFRRRIIHDEYHFDIVDVRAMAL